LDWERVRVRVRVRVGVNPKTSAVSLHDLFVAAEACEALGVGEVFSESVACWVVVVFSVLVVGCGFG